MWKVVIKWSGELLKDGFATLGDADDWYDKWCDDLSDEFVPTVQFIKY